jgi:hypothetical protein
VRRVRRSVADAQLPYNSAFMPGSSVGDRETRTDGERRELIDRIAAGAPVRQLLLVAARPLRLFALRHRPAHLHWRPIRANGGNSSTGAAGAGIRDPPRRQPCGASRSGDHCPPRPPTAVPPPATLRILSSSCAGHHETAEHRISRWVDRMAAAGLTEPRCASERGLAMGGGRPAERRFTVGGSGKSVARCHRTVLAYWKFESISLQRRESGELPRGPASGDRRA